MTSIACFLACVIACLLSGLLAFFLALLAFLLSFLHAGLPAGCQQRTTVGERYPNSWAPKAPHTKNYNVGECNLGFTQVYFL